MNKPEFPADLFTFTKKSLMENLRECLRKFPVDLVTFTEEIFSGKLHFEQFYIKDAKWTGLFAEISLL